MLKRYDPKEAYSYLPCSLVAMYQVRDLLRLKIEPVSPLTNKEGYATLQAVNKAIKHLLNENPITTINLGFGLEIPNGYMGTIRPRSSFNNKGIITYIGTIDSGYRGEIKVNFTSLNGDFHIKKGDRICQLVIEPIAIVDLVEDLGNERGKGGFGSIGE